MCNLKGHLTPILTSKDVFKRALTDLTFKILPNVRVDDRGFLAVTFAMEPIFETAKTNEAHRTSTFTRCDQFVFRQFFF